MDQVPIADSLDCVCNPYKKAILAILAVAIPRCSCEGGILACLPELFSKVDLETSDEGLGCR